MRTAAALTAVVLGLAATDLSASVGAVRVRTSTRSYDAAAVRAVLDGVPVQFEANLGQTDPRVRFLARSRHYTAFLMPAETVFALHGGAASRPEVVRMSLRGVTATPDMEGRGALEGRSHYLTGADSSAWIRDVPHCRGVVTRDVYRGVDLHWRGAEGRLLAYDFAVAPGADPQVISVEFHGARSVALDDGDLVIRTRHGEMRHGSPTLYQDIEGRRTAVTGAFVLTGKNRVGFATGHYDPRYTLIIDPEIRFSTWHGGAKNDEGHKIDVDANGLIYVAGRTFSTDMPTTSAYQSTNKGGQLGTDAFVLKIDPSVPKVVFSTYLGGSKDDGGSGGVRVDSTGDVWAAGTTKSTDFPVTKSALQSGFGGGDADAWLAKLSSAGSALLYSTFHGGSEWEQMPDMTMDGKGAIYMTGRTSSDTDFPLKAAIQSTHATPTSNGMDFYVSKFNSSGSALVYSTFLGGAGTETEPAIAVDSSGNAYVVGATDSTDYPVTKSIVQSTNQGGAYDGVITKVNAAGSSWAYSTYLGGSDEDRVSGVAVDSNGAAYVSGFTKSSDFPTKAALDSTLGGTQDGFVAKIVTSGSSLAYSTYLGGSDKEEYVEGVAVDGKGVVYVTGRTFSTDFPTKLPLTGGDQRNGNVDAFVSALSATGAAFVYSTYFGGSKWETPSDLALDSAGSVYATGQGLGQDFPVKNATQATKGAGIDAWITRFGSSEPPTTPRGLTVTGSTDQRVDLAWTDAGPDETKFELERSTEGGPFAVAGETSANVTTFADTSVSGDTTYTYRVRAVNAVGPSGWSNEVVVVTISSPDQLTGNAVSNTRVDLMWRDRSGSEDGFEVERKRAGDDVYIAVDSVDEGVTSLADMGAKPETTYTYRVRATKGAGASGWSNIVEVTTPPADPADVIPNTRSDTEVRISWKDLSAAETGYEVERGVGCPAPSFARIVTVGPDVTEYVDRAALPETTYSYRVRAINEHGSSGYTAPVCITTAPIAPSAFVGDAMSPSRIRLTWTDNSKIEQGYEVQRTVAGRDEWADIADLPADSTEYLDVGVSQEAAFSYRVRAYDDNGRSRDAMAEGVSTPAALVVRSARLTIPTGRAAKRKKPTLVARGEMDVGGTQVDFEDAATLWIGDTEIAIGSFASLRRGRLLRYDEDGIRLDLKPSMKGASRVPFALKVVGDVAAALEKDGELFLRFRSGAFDAMGVVTLAGGQFNPARGKGTWIDPELNLLSVAATPKRKSFKMRATFPPAERPDTAPEVSVLLDIFEISFEPTAFKQRGPTKYVLSRKLGPVRQKVILDYRRGTLTIVLGGVALQTYEPGTVLVPLAVSIGTTQLQDKPLLVVTKRSFRY